MKDSQKISEKRLRKTNNIKSPNVHVKRQFSMSRLELFDVIDKFLESHAPRGNTKKRRGVGVGIVI